MPLLFVFCVTIQKKIIREKMRYKLESHQLQTITLHENEVKWMDDHEIWLNNQMFDIKTRKFENGVYTFTVMYDFEETKRVKQQEQASGNQRQDDQMLTRLFNCLKGFYFEQLDDKDQASENQQQLFFIATPDLPDYTPSIPTPPPQV